MNGEEFILTAPLYVVLLPPYSMPLVVVSEDDETVRGVAMFTESLFAERTRDEQAPDGSVWEIKTIQELRENHLPLFKSWGYKYVGIDTNEKTGKGWYAEIDDI